MKDDEIDALKAFRDETEPSPERSARVVAHLRTTLADRADAQHLLKTLPEPDESAAGRVAARLRSPRTQRVRLLPIAAGVAAVAAAIALFWSASRPPPDPSEPVLAGHEAPAQEPDVQEAPLPNQVQPTRARAKLAKISTFGPVDEKRARAAVEALGDTFSRCLTEAPGARELTVSIVLDQAGKAAGVNVTGEGSNAYQSCIRAPLLAKSFGTREGVRAGSESYVTPGIVRLSVVRDAD